MPLFFFHILDGVDPVVDEEGSDLPNVDAARAEAIEIARELMSNDVRAGLLRLSAKVDVHDQAGFLFSATFRSAVRVT